MLVVDLAAAVLKALVALKTFLVTYLVVVSHLEEDQMVQNAVLIFV